MKRYFNKIKQEEKYICEMVEILERKKNILTNDNITLEIEVNKIDDIIKNLEIEYNNGIKLKEEIKNLCTDEELNVENIINSLDKKIYDIKEIIIVKQQSQIALEIIRRNNKEIIRNIDKIKNVTIEALNTAVIVAKSIYNQKLVLNGIDRLKKDTQNLILGTGKIIKNEGKEIYVNASNDKLELMKEAFSNVLTTIEEADEQNKKSIPESELKIIELKKLEE